MDPIAYNQQLDQSLASTGEVTATLFQSLADSYSYDVATSVGWVQAKLNVLRARITAGATLVLFDPPHEKPLRTASMPEFKQWVARHFPNASPWQ